MRNDELIEKVSSYQKNEVDRLNSYIIENNIDVYVYRVNITKWKKFKAWIKQFFCVHQTGIHTDILDEHDRWLFICKKCGKVYD
jgi:hypothetical protein